MESWLTFNELHKNIFIHPGLDVYKAFKKWLIVRMFEAINKPQEVFKLKTNGIISRRKQKLTWPYKGPEFLFLKSKDRAVGTLSTSNLCCNKKVSCKF